MSSKLKIVILTKISRDSKQLRKVNVTLQGRIQDFWKGFLPDFSLYKLSHEIFGHTEGGGVSSEQANHTTRTFSLMKGKMTTETGDVLPHGPISMHNNEFGIYLCQWCLRHVNERIVVISR